MLTKTDLTTDIGDLHLNGDADNAATDSPNAIGFTDGVTVTSGNVTRLESSTGKIMYQGRFWHVLMLPLI